MLRNGGANMLPSIRRLGLIALTGASFAFATPGNAAAPGPLVPEQPVSLTETATAPSAAPFVSTAPTAEHGSALATPTGTAGQQTAGDRVAPLSSAAPSATPNAAVEPPQSAASPAPSGGSEQSGADFNQTLNNQIKGWLNALAEQKEFSRFKHAVYGIEPLGPGTHAWLVTVREGQTDVGYLVVTYGPEGKLALGEYGAGSYPLFSLNTLRESLAQRELLASIPDYATTAVKYYLGPLESFWSLTITEEPYYFDAKTGEPLPNLSDLVASLPVSPPSGENLLPQLASPATTEAANRISLALTVPAFDPMDNAGWLAAPPLPLDRFATFTAQLQQPEPLTYVAWLYNKLALFPLAVTGAQEWSDGSAFFAVDQEGRRYLPFGTNAAAHFSVTSHAR